MEPSGVETYLQSLLGPVDKTWAESAARASSVFTILKFMDQPVPASITYATAGLSEYSLPLAGMGNSFQELVLCHRNAFPDWNAPSLLYFTGERILEQRTAISRGEVLDFEESLFYGYPFEALFSTVPFLFPDELYQGDIVFNFLIPITRREADYVEKTGWHPFEEIVIAKGKMVLELNRKDFV